MKKYILLSALLFAFASHIEAITDFQNYITQANELMNTIKTDISILKTTKSKVQIRDIASIEETIAQAYKILQNAQDIGANATQKTMPINLIKNRLVPLENEIDELRKSRLY